MELVKNGAAVTRVSTSFMVERTGDGRKVMKVYAIATGEGSMPVVIGEAVLNVPNVEVAQILQSGIAEMIKRQPAEILRPA
jgi:hypothetical protein